MVGRRSCRITHALLAVPGSKAACYTSLIEEPFTASISAARFEFFAAVCVVFSVVKDTAVSSKLDIVYSNVSLIAIAVDGDDVNTVVCQANC
jgi:hypothetical protein